MQAFCHLCNFAYLLHWVSDDTKMRFDRFDARFEKMVLNDDIVVGFGCVPPVFSE